MQQKPAFQKPLKNKFRWARWLPTLLLAAFLLSALSGCMSDDEKISSIKSKGRVIYNGKEYPIQQVDEEKQIVYIIAPDGVVQTVPLVEVKLVK